MKRRLFVGEKKKLKSFYYRRQNFEHSDTNNLSVIGISLKELIVYVNFGGVAHAKSSFFTICVVSYLLPDKKGKWKHKTPVIKRTLNPTFNHKFSYEELSIDDLKEKVLEIVLYDYDLASCDEFLGGVRLGLGTSSNEWDDATEDECQIWQTMLNRSNVWIQVVVPLRSSMESKANVSK